MVDKTHVVVPRQVGFGDAKPSLANRFAVIACAIFLIGGCFYIFPSGQPQPTDYFMAFVLALSLITSTIRFSYIKQILPSAFIMIIYFGFVGIFQFTLNDDYRIVISPLYYFYNILVMFLFVSICKSSPDLVRRYITFSIVVILVVQLAATLVSYKTYGIRETGTFNDPNQLGYMIILCMFAKIILKNNREIDFWDLLCFGLCALILLQTLSRSATVGWLAILFVCIVFLKFSTAWKLISVSLVIGGFAVGLITEWDSVSQYFQHDSVNMLMTRFGETGADDSFSGRGYNRLWLYPEYLAFGAGEGAYERFAISGSGGEIHSTWANILFSYGVIGFSLFIWLLFRIFRRAPLFHWLLFLGPAGYGMATYGGRFSMFWVVLGLVFGLAPSSSLPRADIKRNAPGSSPEAPLHGLSPTRGRPNLV